MTLTHGSLFSGIGGFDLGFERAGFKTVWQVEIDPYCRKVLEKNFPHAKRFDDIHDVVRWHHLDWVDVISGGFPCQDISNAGKRAGIDGERSGLWSEMWRVIRAMAPRFVCVENVSALLGRGMERVLGDLASGGYDAEWDVLPASAFGAPHIRERVFIIAYLQAKSSCSNSDSERLHRAGIKQYRETQLRDEQERLAGSVGENVAYTGRGECDSFGNGQDIGRAETSSASSQRTTDVAYAQGFPRQVRTTERERLGRPAGSGEDVADTAGSRHTRAGRRLSEREAAFGAEGWERLRVESGDCGEDGSYSNSESLGRIAEPWSQCDWWAVEPDVGRVAHGIPSRVDRLKGLGNAVVPQIAEWIAERIKQVA